MPAAALHVLLAEGGPIMLHGSRKVWSSTIVICALQVIFVPALNSMLWPFTASLVATAMAVRALDVEIADAVAFRFGRGAATGAGLGLQRRFHRILSFTEDAPGFIHDVGFDACGTGFVPS